MTDMVEKTSLENKRLDKGDYIVIIASCPNDKVLAKHTANTLEV